MSASTKKTTPNRAPWIVAGIIVAVIGVAVVVAVATKGDGSKAASGAVQINPVTVKGTPLPAYDQKANPDPAIGMVPPTLVGSSFDGSAVTVAPGGANRLTVFVAHWCPHCQRELPLLVKWIQTGGKPSNLQVSLVSTAVSADRPNYPPSVWLQEQDWPFKVLTDDANETAGTAWGLTAFPYMLLTDGSGKVVWRNAGEISMEDLTKAIQTALPAT